jgi:hypothetical protein
MDSVPSSKKFVYGYHISRRHASKDSDYKVVFDYEDNFTVWYFVGPEMCSLSVHVINKSKVILRD